MCLTSSNSTSQGFLIDLNLCGLRYINLSDQMEQNTISAKTHIFYTGQAATEYGKASLTSP